MTSAETIAIVLGRRSTNALQRSQAPLAEGAAPAPAAVSDTQLTLPTTPYV
jgi:hypothetical protein